MKTLTIVLACAALIGWGNRSFATAVIFDTDVAIDDWSALLFLGKHPEVDLLAVLANGVGETRCPPAMKNIPALLDLTPQKDVAVACGDDYPLDGFFAFPEPWRQQADTLSGVALPPSQRPVSQQHAVELLHQTLSAARQRVVVVATGSLTNIAQWLEKYPADKPKVKRLVIMGGSFEAPGNIIVPGFTDGHPNTRAEWNIFVDALAAETVFASGLPIEVVGLDVTNQVKVTTEFAKDFKQNVSTPAAEFWDKVLDDNDWFIDSGEYYFWDVLAAIVAVEPSFCKGPMTPVAVRFSEVAQADLTEDSAALVWADKTIPTTTVTSQPRKHYDPATFGITEMAGDHPAVKVCTKTRANKAFKLFTKTLNRAD
ncbi:nucleoside hydrolase [Halioxenophilus aromaticivorans]|uniref:Inosine/uridine-preferring nucleoside hydrolase domain-containing protein n=1 Tax=Halioxenophilus aromaticivorans TaxID=1306992 RepID=A0AAV3U3K6_9ALTE